MRPPAPAGFTPLVLMALILAGHSGPSVSAYADEVIPVYEPKPVSLPVNVSYLTETGKVRIVGYNDMLNMLTQMNSVFSQFHSGIEFELDLKGTRTAPPALAAGISAFAPMGAEFEDEALEEYRQTVGSNPLPFRVAHASLSSEALSGPLFFFVHQSNPLMSVSMDDARRILNSLDVAAAITTWGQLGLKGDWKERPIQPCGLAAGTALATRLQNHSLESASFSKNFAGFRSSAEAVQFGADNPNAFCFASYNRRTAEVKPLGISMGPGQPAIQATETTIKNGVYPLDRHLLIYVRLSPCGSIDPLAAEYLNLVLSDTGQAIVAATPEKYLPLNATDIQQERRKLNQHQSCAD